MSALAAGGVSGDVLSGLGVFLGIALTLASGIGVWAAMRVGRNTQTLADYKAAAESSSLLAASLRAELAEVRTRESERENEVASLTAKVAILQDLATGQTALERLTAQAERNAAGITEILAHVRNRQEAA